MYFPAVARHAWEVVVLGCKRICIQVSQYSGIKGSLRSFWLLRGQNPRFWSFWFGLHESRCRTRSGRLQKSGFVTGSAWACSNRRGSGEPSTKFIHQSKAHSLVSSSEWHGFVCMWGTPGLRGHELVALVLMLVVAMGTAIVATAVAIGALGDCGRA